MPSVWSRSPPSAGDPRRPRHKRILGIEALMRTSALHAVFHEVSAGAFDDAGRDRPALLQGVRVVQERLLVGQVGGGLVGVLAGVLVQAGGGGGSSEGAGNAGRVTVQDGLGVC